MPFSGQVMVAEVDGGGTTESQARLTVAGTPAQVWVEFDVMFPQTTLDTWEAAGVVSPDLVDFITPASGFTGFLCLFHNGANWEWAAGSSTGGTVTGNTVYRVRLRWNTTTNNLAVTVNGSLLFTDTDALDTLGSIRVGISSDSEIATVYFDNVIVSAVAAGGSELLDNDFETAIVPDFTSTVGDVSRTAAPTGVFDFAIEGVSIAFGSPLLEPNPPWQRIDNQLRVSRWEIRRGRQGELEKTNTAEATVFVHDTEGWLDPNNPASPWDGQLDGKQLAIARWNPVTEEWATRFRGYIYEYAYNLSPTQQVNDVEIRAVGFMDYLATAELLPGAGHPGGPADMVRFDAQEVDDRITDLFADAGLDPDLYVVFSGNIVCSQSDYDPGYSFLAAVQDAAEAEFPGVANIYEDRYGRVVFHGRHARFSPDSVAADAGTAAWDFQRWKAGDGDAITGDSDYAQIRPPLASDRSLKNVINAALVTPMDIAEADLAGQVVTDAVSIAAYGVRSFTATDLRVLEHKTNGDDGLDQTLKVAQYYVTNYAVPQTRPRQVTLRSLRASDPRATSTWNLICGVDVSDIVHLRVTNPGGAGFDEEFYVEGITESSTPLGPFTPVGDEMDMAEMVLDVSPVAFYNEDTFTDDAT